MKHEVGKQYGQDDPFRAKARLHQSRYRANVLKVGYCDYGNRLTDEDAKNLLNYYEGLSVRQALRKRYPAYSKVRDADMLRSEHIPFNLFAPLEQNRQLARRLVQKAFGIPCQGVCEIRFEHAPEPKEDYLDDGTAFDVYIKYLNKQEEPSGIGVEVKYTEMGYKMGMTERARVEDQNSTYWMLTRSSKAFLDDANPVLGADSMRQIWRNHLLGLAKVRRGEIADFTSVILYPSRNPHFQKVIPEYQALLRDDQRGQVLGCTYEDFIAAIGGDTEVEAWKKYLADRYLVAG